MMDTLTESAGKIELRIAALALALRALLGLDRPTGGTVELYIGNGKYFSLVLDDVMEVQSDLHGDCVPARPFRMWSSEGIVEWLPTGEVRTVGRER